MAEIEVPGSGGETVVLLTQAEGGNMNDAALVGELRVADGCFQIVHEDGFDRRPYTIVWPEGLRVAFDGTTVLVLDADQRVVTRVGERTLLGGSGGYDDPETIGDCPKPFWYAGPDVRSGDAIPSAFD